MDQSGREILQRTLSLEEEEEEFQKVENMVASMLHRLGEKGLGMQIKFQSSNSTSETTLSKEGEEPNITSEEKESTLRERAAELARKWEQLHLEPDEKDELIKRLLGIVEYSPIEYMQGKLQLQKNAIEDQKQSIKRLASQLSMLRKKVDFEKRRAHINNPSTVKSNIAEVLRKHTRIIQDCVFLMKRQILALNKRDEIGQENEKKLFKDFINMVSEQISELKKRKEAFRTLSEDDAHLIVQDCIQELANHVIELEKKEGRIINISKTNVTYQSIYNEYHYVLENQLTIIYKRKDHGDNPEDIFNDCANLLMEKLVIDKENIQIKKEDDAKHEMVGFLHKLIEHIRESKKEGENGANGFEKILQNFIVKLKSHIMNLERATHRHNELQVGSNKMMDDEQQRQADMRELEELTNILEDERKRQQDELIQLGVDANGTEEQMGLSLNEHNHLKMNPIQEKNDISLDQGGVVPEIRDKKDEDVASSAASNSVEEDRTDASANTGEQHTKEKISITNFPTTDTTSNIVAQDKTEGVKRETADEKYKDSASPILSSFVAQDKTEALANSDEKQMLRKESSTVTNFVSATGTAYNFVAQDRTEGVEEETANEENEDYAPPNASNFVAQDRIEAFANSDEKHILEKESYTVTYILSATDTASNVVAPYRTTGVEQYIAEEEDQDSAPPTSSNFVAQDSIEALANSGEGHILEKKSSTITNFVSATDIASNFIDQDRIEGVEQETVHKKDEDLASPTASNLIAQDRTKALANSGEMHILEKTSSTTANFVSATDVATNFASKERDEDMERKLADDEDKDHVSSTASNFVTQDRTDEATANSDEQNILGTLSSALSNIDFVSTSSATGSASPPDQNSDATENSLSPLDIGPGFISTSELSSVNDRDEIQRVEQDYESMGDPHAMIIEEIVSAISSFINDDLENSSLRYHSQRQQYQNLEEPQAGILEEISSTIIAIIGDEGEMESQVNVQYINNDSFGSTLQSFNSFDELALIIANDVSAYPQEVEDVEYSFKQDNEINLKFNEITSSPNERDVLRNDVPPHQGITTSSQYHSESNHTHRLQGSEEERRLLRWKSFSLKVIKILTIFAGCYLFGQFVLFLISIVAHYLIRDLAEKEDLTSAQSKFWGPRDSHITKDWKPNLQETTNWNFQEIKSKFERAKEWKLPTFGEWSSPRKEDTVSNLPNLKRWKANLDEFKNWSPRNNYQWQLHPHLQKLKDWFMLRLGRLRDLKTQFETLKDWRPREFTDWKYMVDKYGHKDAHDTITEKEEILKWNFQPGSKLFPSSTTKGNDKKLCVENVETSDTSHDQGSPTSNQFTMAAEEAYEKTLDLTYLGFFFVMYGFSVFSDVFANLFRGFS